MFCPNCGRKFNDGEQYCEKCGTKKDSNITTVTVDNEELKKRHRMLVVKLLSIPIVIILIIVIIYYGLKIKNNIKEENQFNSLDYEQMVKNVDCGGSSCIKDNSYEKVKEEEYKDENNRKQKDITYKIKNTDLTFSVKSRYTCVRSGSFCLDGSCTCKEHGYALSIDYTSNAIKYLINGYNKTAYKSDFYIVNDFGTVRYNINNKSDLNNLISNLKDFKNYCASKDYHVNSVLFDIYANDGVHSGFVILTMYYKDGNYYFAESSTNKEEIVSLEDYMEEGLKEDNVSLSY